GCATMVGESPAVRAVLERARQIAALEDTPPVLLTGETGTGKGILAHAIHAAGPRASKPFIEVNCTALPATLMEAELFGYERGAFTDAKESKPGLVEAAEGGFLFLDEIGDVDLSVQATLLRAIEARNVRELSHVIERAVLWSRGPTLDVEHLSLTSPDHGTAPAEAGAGAPALPPQGVDLAQWEKSMIERAMREAAGNQTKAAQRLGI